MAERSVGLIVMAEISEMGLVAVLQERGRFNTEKMRPESWPGVCQVTAHGKLKEEESFEAALKREITEELGKEFYDSFFVLGALSRAGGRTQEGILLEVYREETPEKIVITFAAKVLDYYLCLIRLGPDTGGLRFVRREEVEKIVDLRGFNRQIGVPDRMTVAMFPDEKEAVAKAFTLFAEAK